MKQHQREINVGDMVRLNSGSPDLSVISTGNDGGEITVEWRNENGEMQNSTFPRQCFTLQSIPQDSKHGQ
jgi:hypothetical protein